MAAISISPFSIYRQKTQKNIFLLLAIVWILSMGLSWFYLGRISYSCSSTRLFSSYIAGIFFWFLAIPLITSLLPRIKKSTADFPAQVAVIALVGALLVTANQFFVYETVQQSYRILWSYEEPHPCWVNEIMSNNIVVNILFYSMVVHLNWTKTPALKNYSEIMIKDGNVISRVDVASIKYIKVEQNCIHIHAGDRKFVMYSSLIKFSEQLPAQLFIRIHRSVIVNQAKIQQVRNLPVGDAEVILDCGTVLKCSRNFKKNLNGYLG